MEALALLFLTTSQTLGLPPGLLSAICYVESNHRPHVIRHQDGKGDSLGICQIKLTTARMVGFKGTREELMQPKVNIYYAAAYLKRQIKRYGGDTFTAVSAYNRGSSALKPNGLFSNQHYVEKVRLRWTKE